MAARNIDMIDALADPAAHFGRPADVLTATSLTHEQKLQVLEHWEADARELMVASDESMGGGEPARLDEVHDALRKLGVEPNANRAATTMHGHQPDK